jgi:hypothetical protein
MQQSSLLLLLVLLVLLALLLMRLYWLPWLSTRCDGCCDEPGSLSKSDQTPQEQTFCGCGSTRWLPHSHRRWLLLLLLLVGPLCCRTTAACMVETPAPA